MSSPAHLAAPPPRKAKPQAKPQMKCRSRLVLGFTLVELLVVIAIVAILATIAFPSFSNMYARQRAREVAQSITSGIDWARAYAISSSRVVNYMPQADCAWVAWGRLGATQATPDRSGSAEMSPGVNCQAGGPVGNTLVFLPDGRLAQQQPDGTLANMNANLVYAVSGGGATWKVTLDTKGLLNLSLQ